MPRLLLLGYFGAGNFGDDALLVDWLLRRKDWLAAHDLTVDVVYNGEDALGQFAEGREVAGLVGSWIDKSAALKLNPRDYSAMIAPGGSLLQDVTSVKSLLYYLWMIRKFSSGNTRIFLLNQGIGPLNSWLASFLTPRFLARTNFLSVRDGQSYHWATRQGALSKHQALVHSADPVIATAISAESSPHAPDDKDGYVLVIAKPTGDLPTPIDPVPEAEALASMIKHSQRTTGLPHYLLALHAERDLQFCRDVAARCGDDLRVLTRQGETHWGNVVMSHIGNATLVMSYRLHGLVTAIGAGALGFGIAYDPKVIAFCEELALPYCFPATVHEDEAQLDLARYWREREQAQTETTAKLSEARQRHLSSEEAFDEAWS